MSGGERKRDFDAVPLVQQESHGLHVNPSVDNFAIGPRDYVMASILATLFCCWPIGIFAILRSMECRDAIYRGNFDSAHVLSRRARRLIKWSVIVGVAFAIILIAAFFTFSAIVQMRMQQQIQQMQNVQKMLGAQG